MRKLIAVGLLLFPVMAMAQANSMPKDAKAMEAAAVRGVDLMGKFANIVVADENDCARMATDLNTLDQSNPGVMAQSNYAMQHMSAEQKKNFMARYRAPLEIDQRKADQALLKKCSNDKGVQAALKNFK